MPLCHWPCSCYPNHATGQINDWMAEIYERWSASHGVILLTPIYWYQVASPLKLMIDRLVCADGGNPDPTRTSGKNAEIGSDHSRQSGGPRGGRGFLSQVYLLRHGRKRIESLMTGLGGLRRCTTKELQARREKCRAP